MADIHIGGVVTWLKGWFYDKGDVDAIANSKANLNQGQANKNVVTNGSGEITVEDKPVIPSDISNLTDTTGVIPTDVSDLKDSNSHSNIGTSANATQADINTAIDTAIGNISSIDAIQVVSVLPTASSSTMGKLYIISENSKINVYYTEQDGSSYSWHNMDSDILDELSIDWNDITNKPSTFTPSNHTHNDTDVMTEYTDWHGYAQYTTLDYRLGDIEDWISSINVDSTMATILTHIDTNWNHYN